MVARILHRYNESNSWAELNPILGEGELGIESDTGLSKLGDGITVWNQLKYCGAREEDQQYFFASLTYVPKESLQGNLRGKIAYVYIGMPDVRSDRAFIYINRVVDSDEPACELLPISYFSDIRPDRELE